MNDRQETPKPEGPSILADRLFGQAFAQNAQEHLEKAREELARGATEQASEQLRRTGIALANSLTNMTSNRLSENENLLWLNLQHRKYNVEKSGFIMTRILDEGSEKLFRRLERKAFGQDENQ